MICLTPNSDDRNSLEPESRPSSERDAPVLTGAEVRGASPVPLGKYHEYETTSALVSIIVETVWAWIAGIRMRLKIKKDLVRKATEANLTSIDAWIKVD
jgi:hypothetical protein